MASETQTAPDFDTLTLGAKIVGPLGPEVKAAFADDGGHMAHVVSYVACPEGAEECKPMEAPEGTIFTFVHTVYPGANPAEDVSGVESPIAGSATAFVMNGPAVAYVEGSAGYSHSQAAAALGPDATIAVSCRDGGLVWSVEGASESWKRGAPITFFWRSTLPPKGPSPIYSVTGDLGTASGIGPYPDPERAPGTGCN